MAERRSTTSAREEILARVREATATATATPYVAPARASTPASVDLFVERVEDYRAVVERCSAADLADRVAAAVEGARSSYRRGWASRSAARS